MSLFRIFDVAGAGMNAQQVRLNVTASNVANAESVSGSADSAYRARQPVFRPFAEWMTGQNDMPTVRVDGITESRAPIASRYSPDHPLANEEGYIFTSNVNAIEEMVNMLSASRSYQNNIEVMNTSKELLVRTLTMGQ
ncbi:MAG: flagellar basal body rod protein FlgC [Pseudomonadota bacterium]